MIVNNILCLKLRVPEKMSVIIQCAAAIAALTIEVSLISLYYLLHLDFIGNYKLTNIF